MLLSLLFMGAFCNISLILFIENILVSAEVFALVSRIASIFLIILLAWLEALV